MVLFYAFRISRLTKAKKILRRRLTNTPDFIIISIIISIYLTADPSHQYLLKH